ncbi:MAG TPA: tripartite tricarboxylate transporter substrate binding protein [Ramlibacter sp.]|uniref:Bug family tripartite tricarboxylate transporter substrate binding protein n=1 Tax=Ramlibacter sp. TaxID=1917967 RepID=UPI002C809E9A|nr:tripartite tricarboxylate transporter substrate binding protein [Ramlibacter sp.]HVZ46544.1 tripartite tricarboxylate transporter substrate binding protein [Ramlibacter sp.]
MAALVGAAALGFNSALAQAYPAKPIHIIVPYPPGGSSDLLARTLGTRLTSSLGQPVVVENIAGAAGEVGVSTAARRAPDGYTLLVTPNGAITTGRFFKKQPYDALVDLAPVAMLAEIQSVLAVNPSLPVNTLQEFVDYARARPGMLNYSSSGSASAHFLFAEILQYAAGIRLTSVPYKGASPAALAVASGEVNAGVSDLTSFAPLKAAGKVRILATFNRRPPTRSPEIPAAADIVPGMMPIAGWIGVFAPAKTPAPIVAALNREVNAIFARPDVHEMLFSAGAEPAQPMSSEQFRGYIAEEVNTLDHLIKAAGVKLE